MPPIDAFRLTVAAARKYQDHSVPAMFGPLAKATVARLDLPRDGSILDVACGTGALTREIAKALPGTGQIVGTDLNQTMIDVARDLGSDTHHQLSWVASDVTNLPFDDAVFDMACVQQGLQFFPDKPAALTEIRRVLKPGGRLCMTCWKEISPFNYALSKALRTHVRETAATKARAPFSFRDGDLISNLLLDAGFAQINLDKIVLQRTFEDLRAQILALPVEKDMRDCGDTVIERVIEDVAIRLSA